MGPFVKLGNGMIINLTYVVSLIPSQEVPKQDSRSDKIEIRDSPNRYIYVTRNDLEKVVRALEGFFYRETSK